MSEQAKRYRYSHAGPLWRSKRTAALMWFIVFVPVVVLRIVKLLCAAAEWIGQQVGRFWYPLDDCDTAVMGWANWVLSRGETTQKDKDDAREARRLATLEEMRKPSQWVSLTSPNAERRP